MLMSGCKGPECRDEFEQARVRKSQEFTSVASRTQTLSGAKKTELLTSVLEDAGFGAALECVSVRQLEGAHLTLLREQELRLSERPEVPIPSLGPQGRISNLS